MEKNVDRYIDADQVITDRSDNRRTSASVCRCVRQKGSQCPSDEIPDER